MTYHLSARSMGFCTHVAPRLMDLDVAAIAVSAQDYGHTENQSRTLAEQKAKVAQGYSKTLQSKHIIDPATGYSTALDCVPWDGKDYVWDWTRLYLVAEAWRSASIRLGIAVTWGGVWDTPLHEIPMTVPLKRAEQDYIQRAKLRGIRSPFVDGPHFQLA